MGRGRDGTNEFWKSNLGKELVVPPFTSRYTRRYVRALASKTAITPRLASRRFPSQPVGKVEEDGVGEEGGGHVVLEPEDFGNLHLEGHCASYVVEYHRACAVDELSFCTRAVIGPEDDVAFDGGGGGRGPGVGSDGDGSAGRAVLDGEGTGRVESDSFDERVGDSRGTEDVLTCFGDAVPDWRGRRKCVS